MDRTTARLRSQAWWAVFFLGTGCAGAVHDGDAGGDVASDTRADAQSDGSSDAASADSGGFDAASDVGPDASNTETGIDAPSVDAGDSDAAAADAGAATLQWSPCASDPTTECAMLDVPEDYAQPAAGTTRIALRRIRAQLATDRRGSILFNPGGPGLSATAELANFAPLLLPAASELHLRYDLVAFDWRGTGNSGAIRCVDDATFDQLRVLNTVRPDDAGVIARAAQQYVAGCTGGSDGSQFAHVDSTTAARDMEQVRIALGEDKLNYIGVSAGTRLGASYATLFPDRVRAFVLDSSVRPAVDTLPDIAQDAARAEQALNDFAAWCDADPNCPVRVATGGMATLDAIDALITRLQSAPLAVGTRTLSDGDVVDGMLRIVLEPDRLHLANAIAAAIEGDGAMMLQAVDAEVRRNDDGTYSPFYQPHFVIASVEAPFPTGFTDADFATFVQNTLLPGAPRAGAWIANHLPTAMSLAWPRHGATPALPAHAPTAPPMLIVNSHSDGITPFVDAQAMQSALGNGSYLVASDTPGHAQMYRSACIRARAAAFVVDPSVAPDLTPCPAEPPAPDDTLVGTVTDALTRGAGDAMRTQEMPLGDVIADAIRASHGTQLAVINGGGIRAALPSTYLPSDTSLRRPAPGYAAGPPYDLVASDINLALPFHNRVATLSVTGAQLYRILELSVSAIPNGGSSFLQISGFRYTYSASAPAMSRVRTVMLDDGTPVAPDGTMYTLALPDFLYYGGAGFTFLADGTAAVHEELSSALAAYVRAQGALTPATDGRIASVP